jgi:septum formation protein
MTLNGFTAMPQADFILASSSITRHQMLARAGVIHTCHPVSVDEGAMREAAVADGMPPENIAMMLAEVKAAAASQQRSADRTTYVLGCDQILSADHGFVNKPSDLAMARDQLLSLSGKTHRLLTAVVLFRNGQRIWHHLATARLTMRVFDEDFVDAYLAALGDDALISPASYQIEGLGAQLIAGIDGCHYSILGLPLLELLAFLREHGMAPRDAAP